MSKTCTLEISPRQVADLIDDVKGELVQFLITKKHRTLDGDEFDFYQTAQIAGILNIATKTLSALPIPRYPLNGGKIVFYRLSEVRSYLESIREK